MKKCMIIQPLKKEILDVEGRPLRLQGADATNLQLSNAFTSVRTVTSSCFAIQQTKYVCCNSA